MNAAHTDQEAAGAERELDAATKLADVQAIAGELRRTSAALKDAARQKKGSRKPAIAR